MKKILVVIQFFCLANIVQAQNIWGNIDSLKYLVATTKDDSTRFEYVSKLFWSYVYVNPDSSIKYLQQDFILAQKMKSNYAFYWAYNHYAVFASINGNYPEAIQNMLRSLKYAKQTKSIVHVSRAYSDLADIYRDEGDYQHAIYYDSVAISLILSHWVPSFEPGKETDTLDAYFPMLVARAEIFENSNHLDLAMKYATILYNGHMKFYGKMVWSPPPYIMGNIYSKMGNYPAAFNYYRQALAIAFSTGLTKDVMDIYNGMAKTYKKTGQSDTAIYYAKKIIELSQTAHYPIAKLDALSLLSEIYRSGNNIDSLARYLELTIATKDSLFSQQKVMQVQSLTFNEQLSEQELQQKIEQSKLQYKSRLNIYILLAGLLILLIVAVGLWRRNIYRKKSFALLQKQKQETDMQKAKVEQTLEELKTTQSQLIQSEKMASLGELTAGIAHEIQNPLNFVNNFSEVSNELIDELNEELNKGGIEEAKAIGNDIKQNLEKINLHGKRADSIVKGMLQHSRASSGQKELTDINKLADEYLRLSYHGMRARDKNFNAEFTTDFDETIGKINAVPQDIGRVLLNLFNNAFYAVSKPPNPLKGSNDYEPTVSISTKRLDGKILISVKDNGPGIPQNIVDKIFQPFFTTKPTGQGTGLGLSLAYDIIKAHGGAIKVETKEGEGSEFIIQLPN
jgi:signal transduction histidine kinase